MIKLDTLQRIIGDMIKRDPKIQLSYLRANWSKIVNNLADGSQIDYIKGDTIYITVSNSTILHYMRMNSNIYIDKINQVLEGTSGDLENKDLQNKINSLKFALGKIKEQNVEEKDEQ